MKYLPRLEWEFLEKEIKISSTQIIKFTSNIKLNCIKNINIKRNENYEIQLYIKGEDNFHNNNEIKKIKNNINIQIETQKYTFKLESCMFTGGNRHYGEENYYEINFIVNNLEVITKSNEPTYYIKEWYINSTSNGLFYRRGTKFNIEKTYIKEREIYKNKIINIKEKSLPDSRLDSLFIELKEYNFIIEKVPEIFNPKWSKNMSIEYQNNIPSVEIRQKITEILSFIMGRYLIKIGETYYDKNWNSIKYISKDPSISLKTNLKTICESHDLKAIDFYRGYDLEKVISQIINNYILEKEIDLSHIINQLLISTTLPLEAEIIMIGATLDELTKRWFDSKKSESEGLILKKEEYYTLIDNELAIMKEKLKEYPEAYAKIENAYNYSGWKKVDLFLEELNIEIGKSEAKARYYRNIPAHGQEISTEKIIKMHYLTDIYRTLLNRIILKILNFNLYYDLTSGRLLDINEKLSEKEFKENFKEIEEYYKKLNNETKVL